MSAAEKVKVTFLKVTFKKSMQKAGSGRVAFTGSVGGTSFGHSSGTTTGQVAQADLRTGATQLDLAALGWSTVVALKDLKSLTIGLKAADPNNRRLDLGSTSRKFAQLMDLGSTKLLHVTQGDHQDSNSYFTVDYRVEPEVAGAFAIQPAAAVFATRARDGGVNFATVAGDVALARLEICPVRPLPPMAAVPRPVFPPLAGPARTNTAALSLGPNDPINSVPNPAVIPILAAAAATNQTAAKIEFTYYRPSTLNFTDDDPRLEWSASPADKVGFVGGNNKGLSVYVYGNGPANAADVEVVFTVKFNGEEFAKYRALVGHVKSLPCRFNICRGSAGPAADPNQFRPRSTPANIADHVKITNIFLRQIGIQLQLDTDATLSRARPGGGAALNVVADPVAGIFTVDVPDGQTRNAPWNSPWLAVNYRANVLNFCYIKSSSLGALGFAFSWPEHPSSASAGQKFSYQDTGTPSTSWIQPSGVRPAAAAGTVTMKGIAGYNCVPGAPPPPNLYGMVVTDLIDPTTAAGRAEYAGTIAHEVGHMLSLGHRVESAADAGGRYDDELNYPPNQNIMHYNEPTTRAQDLDIIQAKVARRSALIR